MDHIQLWLSLDSGVHRLHENGIGNEIAGNYIQDSIVATVDEVIHAVECHKHLEAACCDGISPTSERILVATLDN